MNEQGTKILDQIINFLNGGAGIGILASASLWIILTGIIGGFFYRWKFLITVGISLIIGMAAAPISASILQTFLKNVDKDYQEAVERILHFAPIYFSLAVFFALYSISFIIFTIICLAKFKVLRNARKSKIWKRFLYGVGTGSLMVLPAVALSASLQTKNKQNDGFSRFSIGFMTFFQSENPSIFLSQLKNISKLSKLATDPKITEALNKDYSKLTKEEKEQIQEDVVKPLANLLNDPDSRKESLEILAKTKITEGKTVSELTSSYSPEIKKAEEELIKNNVEYKKAVESNNEEAKKEILIKEVNKQLDNQLKNGDLSSQLKLVSDSVGLLNDDAKKDVIAWIGTSVDKQLGKDSGFSKDILDSVLAHLNQSVQSTENKENN
ncbi:hypothetical protein NPA08_04445 [Mycoplasmopsis citelli]|uniref:hypothetical protein n=1 Tax=Mycoplasmopsis citelli TaxID=171281 RepID=UPI0021151C42|nr:hypothetical protein [Mycoplasmopsis citelli]UUD36170.1 hypothetical protein NPA08_04445 [Mycoplasmopsis citelli]